MYYDKEGKPLTFIEAAEIMSDMDYRRVRKDQIGNAEVSTVFLVINHNFGLEGPPLIFETRVFGGDLDGEQWRYSTEAEAIAGHEEVVARIKAQQEEQ